MNYKNQQYARQEALIEEGRIFDGIAGGGRFMGKPRPFVLQEPEANLYAPIREKVKPILLTTRLNGGEAMDHPAILCPSRLFLSII